MTSKLTILAGAIVTLAIASPASPQKGPTYVGVVEAYQDSREIPLERQVATVTAHVRALGYGGVGMDLQADQPHSSVRFKSGAKLEFVAKVTDPEIDPATVFQLYPISTRGPVRRISLGGATLLGVHTGTGNKQIPMNFKQIGPKLVLMSSSVDLPPGEYFISNEAIKSSGSSFVVFLFGID